MIQAKVGEVYKIWRPDSKNPWYYFYITIRKIQLHSKDNIEGYWYTTMRTDKKYLFLTHSDFVKYHVDTSKIRITKMGFSRDGDTNEKENPRSLP
jgi:hypothetical protein